MIDPAGAEILDSDAFDRAFAEHMAGNILRAKQQYEVILRSDPGHFDAHHMLGVLLAQSADSKRGITHLLRALEINPESAEAYSNYGNVLRILERMDEALLAYKKALQLDPEYREAGANLGGLLFELGRHEDAVAFWSETIRAWPDFAIAHNGLAMSLLELGSYEEALACCEKSIHLEPKHCPAYANAAMALIALNRYGEAIRRCEEALSMDADFTEAHHNAAVALEKSNLTDRALISYGLAHTLKPTDPQILFNQSLLKLRLGNFEEGLKDHELRWDIKKLREKIPQVDRPRLESLEHARDKKILLCGEQGIGDALQFIRYCQQLSKIASEVHLALPRSLVSLLEDSLNVDSISSYDETLPPTDYFTSLMSLPYLFGTTLQSIPSKVPYLVADPQKVTEWSKRIGIREGLTVGLAWSGNQKHANDRNRSMTLSTLESILSLPGITFVSLQQDLRLDDAALIAQGIKLRQFGAELKDFSDTAALVACMDLVISVDTSIAHLAGGMARPLWILLPFSPDWRWLEGRDSSPWYPTAKLVRQTAIGDWAGVVDRIVPELLRMQGKKSWVRRLFNLK